MNLIRLFSCLLLLIFCANAYSALDPEQRQVFEELKSKALAGDTESQHKMGKWYLIGHHPDDKPDKKIAEFWFLKAADKGFKESFDELSVIYYEKFAYSKERNQNDLAEAHKWRLLSINNDEAMRNVKFFLVYPLSEKTRADGEARAKKFRAEHPGRPVTPSGK